MADEPRRSGRATKGQHKNASPSPPPTSKASKKSAKSKPPKKSIEPEPEDDDDGDIRCICGENNPNDKRAFIACDACTVWQHNVCMGIIDEEDEVPEHYFCEQCRPEEHQETMQALETGDKIWETRNKIKHNEGKMSKNRKSKSGKPRWLKKEPGTASADATPTPSVTNGSQEAGNKRKRDDVKEEQEEQQPAAEQKSIRSSDRQDKRRKSSTVDSKAAVDADTALISIKELPKDRQGVAEALSKIISTDIQQRTQKGHKLPEGQTPAALGEHYAVRIEYALHMNHGAGQSGYKPQFMALNANLKKNAVLIERLLDGTLTADELSTMSSSDMASEEQQRARAVMKEALDRQAMAIQPEGPQYKQDHKGIHLIEDGSNETAPAPIPAPPPQVASPVQEQQPLEIDTKQPNEMHERRTSSQQFDMNSIWAKSAHSPTGSGSRPMQAPARRRSSVHRSASEQANGAKDDPDIDRMLEDNENDDSYSPADATGADAIVWRGKLVQTNDDDAPVMNARFVAGRDIAPTIPWQQLLPEKLSIDGRLQIPKAEEYLCGLRWSNTSDVSVLSLTPYDNAEAFNTLFDYFKTRDRYAVVEKDKPEMVKDLYIMPVEVDGDLPEHVKMLEHCTLKKPIEERLLLASFVVARAPEEPPVLQDGAPDHQKMGANGHLPHHMRQSVGGPAGSPISAQTPTFPPSSNATPPSFPPNPYGPGAQSGGYASGQVGSPSMPPHAPAGAYGYAPPPQNYQGVAPQQNPRVGELLGELQFTPTAQLILSQPQFLTDEQLTNLQVILERDERTRTDFDALTRKLGA